MNINLNSQNVEHLPVDKIHFLPCNCSVNKKTKNVDSFFKSTFQKSEESKFLILQNKYILNKFRFVLQKTPFLLL